MFKIKSIIEVVAHCLLFTLVLSSCATSKNKINLSGDKVSKITSTTIHLDEKRTGINQLREYTIEHSDIPKAFDGKKILFLSDTHLPSLFKLKNLEALTSYIKTLDYDILCLGGDYHEQLNMIEPLFESLGRVVPSLGACAVLGNNDYERGYNQVVEALGKNKIKLLEHKIDTIKSRGSFIQIVGIRNPFDLKNNGVSPTLKLKDNDFVIMLTHTPDYAEDVSIEKTDLVLAGHTHGGQVRIFGIAPIVPSKYDQRFLTGLVYTSSGIPMVVTNGIGTSQKNIRLGAPSEVILIHLKATP